MVADLDNWLCNLYFSIEKINLMDVRATDSEIYF